MLRLLLPATLILSTVVCAADETTTAPTIAIGEAELLKGPNALVRSVRYSPDGTLLAAGESDRTLWIFDSKTRKKLGTATYPPGKG